MKAPVKFFWCLIIAGFFYELAYTNACGADESYLDSQELKDVELKVDSLKDKLGDKAGIPDVRDNYIHVPRNARMLTVSEVESAYEKIYTQIDKEQVSWQIGLNPRELKYPLRAHASFLAALVTALKENLGDRSKNAKIARNLAQFLIWTQQQAGTGVYPFPLTQERNGAAFKALSHFLSEAKKQNKLSLVIKNSWMCDDLTDGGLQFDNSEVGCAMFDMYVYTHDNNYLISAVKSADWASNHSIVRNWNYNAFSIGLLTKAYTLTKNKSYLTAALHKARIGVLPGQLTLGPQAGRWVDQHNARPAYHYIMMQALCELLEVLPKDEPSRNSIIECLRLGLMNRNADFLARGAPTKEKAFTALLAVKRIFHSDKEFLIQTHTLDALHNLELIISSQYLRDSLPLSPREWALFLVEVKEGGLN